MFKKIVIANRGEIAVRIIRGCRDLGISPVAVYSDADRDALHVKLADEAYHIGLPPSSDSYLDKDKIIEVARSSGAEAIHPGYGFLAENWRFSQSCVENGLVFIGPSASSIALMGDKIASRKAVRSAGVPVIPGSENPVVSPVQASSMAAEIGFPVMIKASAGGGGKGMRIVHEEGEMPSAYRDASSEARTYFGDPTVYLEKLVESARHIEVQVLADAYANSIHLGERECSIQRRHQKLVEESPSPIVDPEFRAELGRAALAVSEAADYRNAGTVEFLVDTAGPRETWRFYFLEMNTRLQVEHPVTEMVTDVDLVREQILIAAGEKLSYRQEDIQMRGAAIECRIYAEDPSKNFIPSPGRITTLFEPSGPGIRHDSGVYEGFVIPIDYDPLISKLVAQGRSRSEAIQRMKRALGEYRVGGVKTTIPFFKELLSHQSFLKGQLHTDFIKSHGLIHSKSGIADMEPLIAAAVEYFVRDNKRNQISRPQRSLWKESARRYWE
jgi:acetyl-CoA carboxylase biotin carboxylase subunit